MQFTVVIPARFAATRLPGKPLLDIGGKPMLQHVYDRARQSDATEVLIATDDERIADTARRFGARVCMTSPLHRTGTDRIQEVAQQLALHDQHVIVNVQGDEPLIPPAVINQVAQNLLNHPDAGISTLCEVISHQDELINPNAVKVVFDSKGMALYFSRATIPYGSSVAAKNCFRHIGIYAYRVATLNNFVLWPPGELEIQEKLEQLRALSQGVNIHVAVCSEKIPAGVDTEQDLQAAREYFASL